MNTVLDCAPECKLIWATPNGDNLVGYLARVSNPKATIDDPSEKLIAYLIKHKHWSPFQMVDICIEIKAPRDITRQTLRHKSFDFQEFSGRYAAYESLYRTRDCRMQDTKNRQNSLECTDENILDWWEDMVDHISEQGEYYYNEALKRGIAKECARAILPEGLVPTKMYVKGDLRSWIHYIAVRTDPSTQKEHRDIALACADIIFAEFPNIKKALSLAITP
jgi:thymidylate synthase (FAD)